MDADTAEMFISMPERIAGFDGPLFERLRRSCAGRSAAVVEVAGRDSVAAAVAACSTGAFDVLVPTVVYTGTEYGDRGAVMANAAALSNHPLVSRSATVLETVVLGSPAWWNASATRFSSELFPRYGFVTPCVACHMYLHASRVPLARAAGARAIIAGERLSHDGRSKINQMPAPLAAYREVVGGGGVDLLLPLESTASGAEVDGLAGPGWRESERQMSCALAGNYRDVSGAVCIPGEDLLPYLEEFLVPFTRAVLRAFEESGAAPDYIETAARVLEGRGSA